MKTLAYILQLLSSLLTSFASTFMALWFIKPILEALPLSERYFPGTPIQGVTYGELVGSISIAIFFAYAIGWLHGRLYGRKFIVPISAGTMTPFIWAWVSLIGVTMGMGIFALPVVVALGITVVYGAKKGAAHKQKNQALGPLHGNV